MKKNFQFQYACGSRPMFGVVLQKMQVSQCKHTVMLYKRDTLQSLVIQYQFVQST